MVDRAATRCERVFLVYGMRRSGNHALIRWLVNALEERPADVHESDNFHRFAWSDSGHSFLINDLTIPSSKKYRRQLYRHRDRLRSARFVIFSAEDRAADIARNWRVPSRCEHIAIQRDTLNLMASRFQRLQTCAQKGIADHSMEMRQHFFDTLSAQLARPQGTVWSFDQWLSDADWRRRFLAEFGLSKDITPNIANEGGGSSFTGVTGIPDPEALRTRFRMIEPTKPWARFLRGVAARRPELFSAAEHDAINAFVN